MRFIAKCSSLVLGLAGSLACSGEHGPEGTLVSPGPGIEGLPGGSQGVTASRAVPISGGTLRVTRSGKLAIAADPDRDRVFVVDLESHDVREIELESGDEPGRSTEDAAGRVHVVMRRGGALVSIEPETASVVARRSVCPSPRGVDYDAASDSIHVACQAGELVTLPASGGAASRVLELGWDLRDVVVDGERLLVSRFKSAELLVVDGQGQITRRLTPAAGDPGFNAAGFEPAVAWRTLALPGGRIAMLHQRANPGEIAIGPAGYYSGAGSCSGAIVEGGVSRLDPDAPEGSFPPSLTLAMLIGPSDLAISPDGQQMALVSIGNSWNPTRAGTPLELPKLQIVPTEFSGDDCGGDSGQDVSGEPIAVAFDLAGRVLVQSREPAQLQIIGGPVIRLSNDSRADTGIALFHMNSGFGISCASCHPEGTEDGRTWQFAGVGPRRTQTMAGGVMATAPFHWSGDVDDFPALIHEVFESRMGGARPNKPQIAAFGSWVDRIEAPVGAERDAGAVERGRFLFEDSAIGCTTCHSGSRFTNNQSYDVGTGAAFQVPSLLGVGSRAPYMHSGCAETLHDRFGSCGGGDVHGRTSQLSAAQRDDLVKYLETL